MKVEGTSAQYAEEEIPSGDCEKSKGVESKMADGQQPDLAEGGKETQNANQETISTEETVVETKPLLEKSASDTDGKVCVTHYLSLPRGLYGAIAKVYHS